MSSPLIFIDGDQGTTGLQIHGMLRDRQDITLLTLPDAQRKDPQRRAEAINSCDIAILCLPDGAAREAAASIVNPRVRVIDASSAHRTHADWVYGFPEMTKDQAERIAGASRVSNPGCYPTGAIGLLRPLLDAGAIPADYPISIHAVSGYSGRGRAGVDEHEGPNATKPSAYRLYGLELAHKHPPEIQQRSGLAFRPMFVPSYSSYRQGIVLTIPIETRLLRSGADAATLHQCLVDHYAGQDYVQVMPMQAPGAVKQIDPEAMNGTNVMQLSVFGNAEHGQVLLCAVLDNLGKGASGAAVQNLALMLA
ncbi:N-acetyl-gamma-glutamyl-phosphate reductase [Pandoraea fibrosis]|uniref:N-acetyl-gamma-glutamyl-phosphate reductase n=1 Tax=Pandoraea fibrosis TaxID=1891094 RepID=A0A5E4VKM8_9BURK|nr:N-acetyl-gamma-glutamyl-phosphate reductase [Pandoraea fibrosis]QHE91627.1 N-acetyl-gamma-glutamyl-phosphate reductase [Pandoraea fibrosis]QHF14815.1 N-acetyl-gamma-glutamyl-phosphate reductase [Pandoraea fibrosis]VVE11964.1 N-acetyl-gamma-glutamyl-phosphate reductase [Pandoraea fibrosis]